MVFCFPSHTVWKSGINVKKEFNKYIIVLKLLAVNHFLYYQSFKTNEANTDRNGKRRQKTFIITVRSNWTP